MEGEAGAATREKAHDAKRLKRAAAAEATGMDLDEDPFSDSEEYDSEEYDSDPEDEDEDEEDE